MLRNECIRPISSIWLKILNTLWVPAILLAGLTLFWPAFIQTAYTWSTPEFSHGPLSLLMAGFLFLHVLSRTPEPIYNEKTPKISVALLVIAFTIAAVARFANLGTVSALAFVLVLLTTFTCATRPTHVYRFIPVFLTLIFALPLQDSFFWRIQNELQDATTRSVAAVLWLAGVDVEYGYNTIEVAGQRIFISQSSSGLRYLLPLASCASILAALLEPPRFMGPVLIALAVPVTLIGNIFRVSLICVVVNLRGDLDFASGFSLYLTGWLFFIAMVGVMFWIFLLATRMAGDCRPLSKKFALDFGRIPIGTKQLLTFPASRMLRLATAPLLVAALFGATSPILITPLEAQKAQNATLYDDWVVVISRETAASASNSSVVSTILTRPDPYEVVLYTRHVRMDEFSRLFAPGDFLVGMPRWEVEQMRYLEVRPQSRDLPIRVANMIVSDGGRRQRVLTWYEGGCGPRATWVGSKLSVLCTDNDRTAGGWVRLATDLNGFEESADMTEKRLRDVAEILLSEGIE